jgi:endogenous inhibitor of DNA gyrase (YacG/DUF329 family)
MDCPICKRRVEMSPANRFRPFCSERCQMIDLGKWAGGNYNVEGGKSADTEHPDDFKKRRLPG